MLYGLVRMWIPIVAGLLVALGIAYFVLSYLGSKPTYQGKQALFDLSKPNQEVLSASDAPWTPYPTAVRFAVFVEAAPRTIQAVDCVDAPTTTPLTQFKPACSDYEFRACACDGNNCDRCKISDTTYVSRLLGCGNTFELWASGYTTQNDKPYVPALLRIQTQKDSNQRYVESVSLPAIPLQRWTVITIVKEGRRFDVYYGEVLVASKLLDYVPVQDYNSSWTVGANQWVGKIGLFAITKAAQGLSDIKKDIESLINTRGVPYYLDQIKFDFQVPSFTGCLMGNCNPLPTVKPPNPFTVYASSVS